MARSIIINNDAWIPKELFHGAVKVEDVKDDLELRNTALMRQKSMGFHRPDEDAAPEYFTLWRERGDYLVVPRSYYRTVLEPQFRAHRGDFPVKMSSGFRNFLGLADQPIPCTITLRERQTPAYEALVTNGGGTIQLACGAGKTPTALKYAADRGHPTLIIVNTNTLLDQWVKELLEATESHPRFFPTLTAAHVGRIQQKVCDFEGKTFVVAMIHTLAKRPFSSDLYKYFGTVIMDEVHHLSANYFNSVANKFWGVRIGLSASAQREDGMDPMFTHHIGEIVHTDLKQALLPDIYFLESGLTWERLSPDPGDGRRHGKDSFYLWNKTNYGEWRNTGKINFGKLVTHICADPDFNEMILGHIGLAAEAKRKVLILGERVDQLEFLQESWAERSEIPCGLVVGKKKGPERKAALETQVVFATAKLAEEGLDCPSFDSLFIIVPKSPLRFIQQAVGRILRVKEGKSTPIVVIFAYKGLACKEMTWVYDKVRANLRKLEFPFQKFEHG